MNRIPVFFNQLYINSTKFKMKIFILITSIFLLVNLSKGQNLKVITYNLRYDNPYDGTNRWDARKNNVASMVKFYEPDFFDVQEALNGQVDFLDSSIGYKHIGVGRDDGAKKGEYSAIFYNDKKFKLIKFSYFWLSETPEKPSKGWDAACIRICTYGLFQDINTKKFFWVFNTHLDHEGIKARKNSVELIVSKIHSLNTSNFPVILTGDFNLEPTEDPIKYVSQNFIDSRNSGVKIIFGPEATFNSFDFTKPPTERIDYIFVSKTDVKVLKYAVFNHSVDCRYPSDHFPVYAELGI